MKQFLNLFFLNLYKEAYNIIIFLVIINNEFQRYTCTQSMVNMKFFERFIITFDQILLRLISTLFKCSFFHGKKKRRRRIDKNFVSTYNSIYNSSSYAITLVSSCDLLQGESLRNWAAAAEQNDRLYHRIVRHGADVFSPSQETGQIDHTQDGGRPYEKPQRWVRLFPLCIILSFLLFR